MPFLRLYIYIYPILCVHFHTAIFYPIIIFGSLGQRFLSVKYTVLPICMIQHWHIRAACISFWFFFTSLCNKDAQTNCHDIKTTQIYYLMVLLVRSPGLAKTDSLLRLSSGCNQAINWVVLFSEAGDLLKNLLGCR